MPDRIAGNPPAVPMPQERICRSCGRTFILRQNEQEVFSARGWDLPKICMECNRAAGEQRERERLSTILGSRRRIRDGVRKRRGNKRFFMIV